ncbi:MULTISPECIES: hypothetical protein [unclassified Enterococcus]|uniref:hypothetical protein n=1 Tax=unclassified Enterococcus TaxID=2608891 RepID=UPI001556BFAC|nr:MULTISPECIES: hypothetical protein [unclassified Enterococcus]MBS7577970.1 hypothetical protein [Enterococcus sp. MMGLQ5-2]MBS7585169.1 hypothetical protein [Enterococcus sp. MMGLQ5-1]NPD13026.1 hypothetical protein [Enterococcus sp. MMGLQ5-1]NPD37800.1 hypothetical protein [Enterococcus sp. MMGLQ5-2]
MKDLKKKRFSLGLKYLLVSCGLILLFLGLTSDIHSMSQSIWDNRKTVDYEQIEKNEATFDFETFLADNYDERLVESLTDIPQIYWHEKQTKIEVISGHVEKEKYFPLEGGISKNPEDPYYQSDFSWSPSDFFTIGIGNQYRITHVSELDDGTVLDLIVTVRGTSRPNEYSYTDNVGALVNPKGMRILPQDVGAGTDGKPLFEDVITFIPYGYSKVDLSFKLVQAGTTQAPKSPIGIFAVWQDIDARQAIFETLSEQIWVPTDKSNKNPEYRLTNLEPIENGTWLKDLQPNFATNGIDGARGYYFSFGLKNSFNLSFNDGVYDDSNQEKGNNQPYLFSVLGQQNLVTLTEEDGQTPWTPPSNKPKPDEPEPKPPVITEGTALVELRDKDTNQLLTVGDFTATEASVTGKKYRYDSSPTHTGTSYQFQTAKGVTLLNAVTDTYHKNEVSYYLGGYDYWYDDNDIIQSSWNAYKYYYPAISANPDVKVTVTQTKAPENYYLIAGQGTQADTFFNQGVHQDKTFIFYNYRKADLNVQRIEIDTDKASAGLPVRVYLNKKASSTDADQQKFTLNLYNQTTNQKVYTWGEIKIGDLPLGTATKTFTGTIPTSDLSVNQKQSYEARIESFNADKVQLKNGKLDTEGYTAVEKSYTATIDTTGNQTGDSQGASFTFTKNQAVFKGVVQTSREQGLPIEKDEETIAWSYTKIPNTKSGYGFERKLTTNYVIEGSRAKANFDYAYDLVMDKALVEKDTYVPYTAVGSQAKLPLDATTNTINTIAVHQVAEFPKVQSEKMTGAIFTDEQVTANDSRITTGKTEGFRAAGRKFYTPIWAKIRNYEIDYQSTKAMGVHAINVRLKDNVNVYAQLWVTMDSVTQKYDELMIIPVFPDEYVPPASWPSSATTWLRDTIKQDSEWHGTKYVLNDEGVFEEE